MKRFHLSNHIYYLFKSNNNEGSQNSYEDVFVPKIFINLFNLSNKPKKHFNHKKNNQTKFFSLNSNSYFPNKQMGKLNTIDINNNFLAYKKFGNNKRYFSAVSNKIQTHFPTLQKANINKNINIKNINKPLKNDNKSNKKTHKQIAKIAINRKLNIQNKIIKIKNLECPKFVNEIEKNKEEKTKRFINLSGEYIKKKKNNSDLNDLDSFLLKNQNELSSLKINDFNNNDNYYNKKFANNLIQKYQSDKSQAKKYKPKILMRSIPFINNLNKDPRFFSWDYSLFAKKKIVPNLPKLTKEDPSKLCYKTEEKILKLIYKRKIDFPLINDNELYPTEKFYFCVNKRYRYQLIKYMKHRINWEFHESNSKCYDGIIINFEWKYYSHKVNFKNFKYKENIPLKKIKMINLFEKNYEIGNKKNMFINLISYCDSLGYNIFDLVPFTLIISNTKNLGYSFSALKELMEFIPKENNLDNNILTNRKYKYHFWFDKNYLNINNQYIYFNKNFISSKNYWILKPPDLYQGKCIEIGNDYEELFKKCKKMFMGVDKTNIPEIGEEDYDEELYDEDSYEDESNERKGTKFYCCNDIIVQKYLDNPLLYQKRKFDIRCFVLLDSNLNVFFCREGHLKGCSEFYNINDTNKFIHITNYSFQKNSSNFERFEIGNEISYNDFKKFMIKECIPLEKFDKMIEHMKFLIQISLKAVSKKLTKVSPVLCFEIFGYDFIVDNEFRPWILEINDNPGLCISSPVIAKIIPRMLDDAFRLTIDVVFNTKYSVECFDSRKKYKSKFHIDGFTDDENIFEFLCNLN